ncbi:MULTISPECIES: hypothetical protein [Cyanophyceae]|nr:MULTISPECIES: hypothetical protein [Cyanophyceae]
MPLGQRKISMGELPLEAVGDKLGGNGVVEVSEQGCLSPRRV